MRMYMAVTTDKYELPLAVRDKARELAELFGVSVNAVNTAISRNQSGSRSGVKFVKVEDLEDETERESLILSFTSYSGD